MVTTPHNSPHEEGSIYAFNAEAALAAYEAFVQGDVNDTLVVVSQGELAEKARTALEASANKLGFGKGAIAWVRCEMSEGTLGAQDLANLIEGIDPIALIAADASAAALLSKAFAASLKIDEVNRVRCRTILAFANFAAMLESDEAKQKAWRLLKRLV